MVVKATVELTGKVQLRTSPYSPFTSRSRSRRLLLEPDAIYVVASSANHNSNNNKSRTTATIMIQKCRHRKNSNPNLDKGDKWNQRNNNSLSRNPSKSNNYLHAGGVVRADPPDSNKRKDKRYGQRKMCISKPKAKNSPLSLPNPYRK